MKKIILLVCFVSLLFTSCLQYKYTVYVKDGRKIDAINWSYSKGIPEFGIHGCDVDSVRLKGDTMYDYKYYPEIEKIKK